MPIASSKSNSSTRPLFPRLLIATRPWSFPAALSPLLITFTIMFLADNLEISKAVVFSLSIISIQGAANLLNSFLDFERGLDRFETAGDRTMVDGLVTRKEFPFLFFSVAFVWVVSFILSLPFTSWVLYMYLAVYAVGVALGVMYSAGSRPLKYMGFGDLTVFLAFGPLLVVAAAWACGKDPSALQIPKIIISTIPASILVVAILHANNHRDLKVDARHSANTLAVLMGHQISLIYYGTLVLAPSLLSVLLALSSVSHAGMAAGGLTFPLGLRLVSVARRKTLPRDIDAETAKLMLLYGILTSLGIGLVG